MKIARLFKMGAAAFALALTLCSALWAADLKPVAAVSLSGYDELDGSIEKVLDTAGYKEFHTVLTSMTDGVDGIDKSKPLGFVLLGNGNDLIPVAFLPVADFDALTCPGIEVLKEKFNYNADEKTITIASDDADDEIDGDEADDQNDSEGMVCRLVQQNEWLFVVPLKNESALPAQIDPAEWVEGFGEKYLLGGVVHVDRVPAEIIDSLFAGLRVEASKDEKAAEGLESLGKLADFVKANVKAVEFGLSVDQSSGDIVVSSMASPVADSSFAKSLEQNAHPVTRWSDFYDPDNSILAVSKAEVVESEMVEFQKSQWDSVIGTLISSISGEEGNEQEIEEAKSLVGEWQAWGDKNYDSGKSDGALSVGIDGTLSFAATIADGAGLQTLVEKTFEFVKKTIADDSGDDPDAAKFRNSFKVNANQYKGYYVSTFVLPVSDLDKNFSFLIGVKDDAVILIAGTAKKRVSDLFKEKTAVEHSESDAPQRWVFSVPNLAKFALTFDDVASDEIGNKVASALAEGSADAVVSGQSECTEEGLHQWFTIKGELIKLICDTVGSLQSEEDGVEGDETDSDSDSF